jgi:hypothetical protein
MAGMSTDRNRRISYLITNSNYIQSLISIFEIKNQVLLSFVSRRIYK